jgi:hypothetical protein
MRKLFTLLGFLLVPVTVAGAAYGYYWYQVKTSVDRMVEAAAPFASISYAGIVAKLDGSAGARGVQIVPAGSRDSVRIGSILFRAQDPLFYLDAEKKLREGAWPEHMALSFNGLDVGLDADFMKQLEAIAGFEALACGDVERFDLATTRSMKYQRLNMDLLLAMDFMPRTQSLRLRSDVTIADMAQTGFYVDLSLASNELSVQSLIQSQPTLERVTLDYSDLGYNMRRNRFCAQRGGYAPADYPQRHADLVQAELKRLGWSVSDALIQSYASMQRPQAIVQVIAEPPPGFGAQALGSISSPEQVLDLLNLRLSVNGVNQDLAGISWSLQGDEETTAAVPAVPEGGVEGEADLPVEKPEAPEDLVVELEPPKVESKKPLAAVIDPDVVQVMPGIVVKAKAVEKAFRPTALQQVHRYAGQPVRLRTYFGRRIEGTLVRVADGNLEVEQRLDRGVAIFPIAADKVAEVSVFR